MRGLVLVALIALFGGCSDPSLDRAIKAQQRADQIQQAASERQHAALRALLFRDLVSRLEASGGQLTAAQRAALSAVWNDRDLVEFWALQQERAAALRLVGVASRLYAEQAPVDLLLKSVERRAQRAERGVAAAVAEGILTPVDGERR